MHITEFMSRELNAEQHNLLGIILHVNHGINTSIRVIR